MINNLKKIAQRIPTVICFLLFLVILFSNLEKSGAQNIFLWSYLRFAFLLITLCLVLYCLISLSRPKLLYINNYICYLAVITLLFIEILIRYNPNIIPDEMILYLPQKIRTKLASQRGFFSRDIITGDNLLYHYQPYQKLLRYPYVTIDQYGYRNSATLENQVDIVILGDSLTSAEAAEKDLGDLFREQGYSAINLGMGGYSPQHYRDAYKKYIIDQKISHQFVLTFLFIGNDIKNSYDYAKIFSKNGNYFDYLQEKNIKYYSFLPWTLNITRGIPLYLFHLVNKKEEFATVELPYETMQIRKFEHNNSLIDMNSSYLKQAIDEINTMAVANKAIPIVFIIPNPDSAYVQFNNIFSAEDQFFLQIKNELTAHFQNQNILFINIGDTMKEAIKEQFIFPSKADCHFNTWGVEKIFETVLNAVKNIQKNSFN